MLEFLALCRAHTVVRYPGVRLALAGGRPRLLLCGDLLGLACTQQGRQLFGIEQPGDPQVLLFLLGADLGALPPGGAVKEDGVELTQIGRASCRERV